MNFYVNSIMTLILSLVKLEGWIGAVRSHPQAQA